MKDLFTQSPSMRDVAAFVELAHTGRGGVLICGEDGSGRSVVAQAIHGGQATPTAPFITVDCAAFGAGELELRLFGSIAREGAGDDRVDAGSLIAQASGGTLYFQNLAETPARVQARLVRILNDRDASIAGPAVATPLDVRPMAGVDPGVEASVREGGLREDLFRCISALRIDIPPLRNRRDDIPAVANYLVQDICARSGTLSQALSPAAHTLIAALPWRGNAAELRTLLESVVRSREGQRTIDIEDVLAQLRLHGEALVSTKARTLRQARARFERDYISAVLEQHRGRIPEAAKTLGIQRTNLYRKMRSLDVGRIKKDTSPISS